MPSRQARRYALEDAWRDELAEAISRTYAGKRTMPVAMGAELTRGAGELISARELDMLHHNHHRADATRGLIEWVWRPR